jgi:hypothetical protein
MKKLHKDFPVYVIENFHQLGEGELEQLIPIIIQNKERHRMKGAASFWLQEDDEKKTFTNLYNKFESSLRSLVQFNIADDNTRICNVYHSTKTDYVEVIDSQGRPFYHNHKHVVGHFGNITTLAGVYYMNVPDTKSGSIDFKIDYVHQPDGTLYAIDKDMQYTQLNKRPYEFIAGVRITTMKEISYQPKNGDLVLFPSYLDHRPHVIKAEGHRIAINFELKTVEHPEMICNVLDQISILS